MSSTLQFPTLPDMTDLERYRERNRNIQTGRSAGVKGLAPPSYIRSACLVIYDGRMDAGAEAATSVWLTRDSLDRGRTDGRQKERGKEGEADPDRQSGPVPYDDGSR